MDVFYSQFLAQNELKHWKKPKFVPVQYPKKHIGQPEHWTKVYQKFVTIFTVLFKCPYKTEFWFYACLIQ